MDIKTLYYKIRKYIRNPRLLYIKPASKRLEREALELKLCDEEYIKRKYRIHFGKELNLNNPKTFNEKMQWIKLYDRNPFYTTMADKCAVKNYISKVLGEQFIAKQYGCWERYEDIDFENLPRQFVLKTTHGSGGVLVCKDKEKMDFSQFADKFNKSLKDNYFFHSREWPYKNIKPQIIAEELLVDEENENLPVYKFFCFSGEPYIAQVIQNDKHVEETIDYVDMKWNRLKLKQNFPNSKHPLKKPECLDEAIKICRLLSKDIPFVRCDLYIIKNKIYFSEFTFFSDAGFVKFHPNRWDFELGKLIKLDNSMMNRSKTIS